MGKSLFGIHKGIDKKKEQDFIKRLDSIKRAFLQFQIDNDARCAIINEFQDHPEYPQPNILVDLICNSSRISWRPMEKDEKDRILEVIKKKDQDEANKIQKSIPRT